MLRRIKYFWIGLGYWWKSMLGICCLCGKECQGEWRISITPSGGKVPKGQEPTFDGCICNFCMIDATRIAHKHPEFVDT